MLNLVDLSYLNVYNSVLNFFLTLGNNLILRLFIKNNCLFKFAK